MLTYLINLDQRPDRLAFMQAQLGPLGLAYQRISAVNGMGAASALWIVAVPLFDMFSAIIRRVAEGRTPMSPDRKHMHHLLIQRGMQVNGAVLTMNLAAFICGAIGVIGWLVEVPQYYLFWALIALFVAYMAYAYRFWQTHDQSIASRQGMFKAAPDRP